MSGTSAFTATTKSSVKCAWDMYDLGASHHTSPCQEDFINFEVIPAKPLTAANKEKFMAEGIGEMMIRLPNGDKEVKMRLTQVLYTPALSFMLISVGCIDDTGYWSTFGGGMCQIKTSDGTLIGNVLKSGGVY